MKNKSIVDLFTRTQEGKLIITSTDKYVYHYTNLKTALEKILYGGKIRISSIVNTNDPYEQTHFYLAKKDKNKYESINDKVNTLRRFYKVLCTSQDRQVKGSLDLNSCNNLINSFAFRGFSYSRMWAQYAENHRGICLIFDKSELDKTISAILAAKNEIFSDSVKYVELPGNAATAVRGDAFLIDLEKKDAISNHFNRYRKELFFQKSHEWQMEYEYRWIVYSKDSDNSEFVSIVNSIAGIIVGAAFPEVYTSAIRPFCEKYDIPAERIIWMNGAPITLPLQE